MSSLERNRKIAHGRDDNAKRCTRSTPHLSAGTAVHTDTLKYVNTKFYWSHPFVNTSLTRTLALSMVLLTYVFQRYVLRSLLKGCTFAFTAGRRNPTSSSLKWTVTTCLLSWKGEQIFLERTLKNEHTKKHQNTTS